MVGELNFPLSGIEVWCGLPYTQMDLWELQAAWQGSLEQDPSSQPPGLGQVLYHILYLGSPDV